MAPPRVVLRPAGSPGGPARVALGEVAVFEVELAAAPGDTQPRSYGLRAEGLPDGAARFAASEVTTNGRRAAGPVRLEVVLPPGSTRPGARVPFSVVAQPLRDAHGRAGRAAGAIDVAPAGELLLALSDRIVDARRRARVDVVVSNRGTVRVQAALVATDAPGRLRTRMTPNQVDLAPGASVLVVLELEPRDGRATRRSVTHEVAVQAYEPDGRRTAAAPLRLVQRPYVPWRGVVVAAALGAGCVAAAVLAARPDRVEVPRLTGAADLATAEGIARGAGLDVAEDVRTTRADGQAPGSIVAQSPAPGDRLARGQRILVVVAVGAETVGVPRLVGSPAAGVGAAVAAPGLSLAPPLAAAGAPAEVVVDQLPLPGRRVPAGTPVQAVLGPAPGLAAAGLPVRVPGVAGTSLEVALHRLAAAGLAPQLARRALPGAAGRVLGTTPPPGSTLPRGTRVALAVSAGTPQLAYGTPDGLRVVDPFTGRAELSATPALAAATEPSWSPDGRRLVYRTGRRLVEVTPATPATGQVLYAGPDQYVDATLAPALDRDLLALIRRRKGDGDLCFAKLTELPIRPQCLADDGWDLGRQVAWSPDGRSLLVFGARHGRPSRFGILRFDTARPFATDPATWHGRLVTDGTRAGRGAIAAAWSPDGRRVALASNAATGRFQVVLTRPSTLLRPPEAPLPVRACQLAWRPDGRALAVVAGDDTCSDPFGTVSELPLDRTRSSLAASLTGRAPAYQPLTYAPGTDGR